MIDNRLDTGCNLETQGAQGGGCPFSAHLTIARPPSPMPSYKVGVWLGQVDNWNNNCEAKREAKSPRPLRGLQVDFSLTRNVSYAVR